jgi:DNA-binding CsgD family transcriptional regulator
MGRTRALVRPPLGDCGSASAADPSEPQREVAGVPQAGAIEPGVGEADTFYGGSMDGSAAWAPLTPREHEVLRLLTQRATDPEIAAAMGVALSTARSWSANVRWKLGVRSRRAISPPLQRNVRRQA